ncbi:K(+)-transporting ATPase subunit F [Marinomonas spartinae]|uniref:K(+)-transporting ATPase subunit F n=1 Tax=Marinomonas spartinae TaxID=1792290 RepID=UPI003AF05A93
MLCQSLWIFYAFSIYLSRYFTPLISIVSLPTTSMRRQKMAWLLLVLSIVLFIYLMVAMFAPEKF